MIIFGWNHITIKQIGVTFKNLCSHCHNEEYWILTRSIKWFTLFFIPIIPYSIEYTLSCPICQYGTTLQEGKQLDDMKFLAENNQLLMDGKITLEQYQAKFNQLGSGDENQVQDVVAEVKEETKELETLSFCTSCGTGVTKEIKFCGNCGVSVAQTVSV